MRRPRKDRNQLDVLAAKEQGRPNGRLVTRREAKFQRETLPRQGTGAGCAAASGFITVALSALAVPATSSAQRAVHLRNAIDIGNSFQSPLLGEACGFPETVTVTGAVDETLIYNNAGLVAADREHARGDGDFQLALRLFQLS